MEGLKNMKKETRTLKSMKGRLYTRMDSGQKFTLKKLEKQYFQSQVVEVNKVTFDERTTK